MIKLINTSFGVLFLASVGSLVADVHVFFPSHERLIAGIGITMGLVLSLIGLVMYLKGR